MENVAMNSYRLLYSVFDLHQYRSISHTLHSTFKHNNLTSKCRHE